MAISIRILDQCRLRNVFVIASTFPSGKSALVHGLKVRAFFVYIGPLARYRVGGRYSSPLPMRLKK
ncbi:hypothetical protein HanIR_Chr15g0761121 [Helianthus annuus]|nr:hypothetical protein HanIR_Chr15g0761121 [Helianthus annuus]